MDGYDLVLLTMGVGILTSIIGGMIWFHGAMDRLPPDSLIKDPKILRRIALSSIYSKANDSHDLSLCGENDLNFKPGVIETLRDAWGIDGKRLKKQMRNMMESLGEYGHRFDEDMRESAVKATLQHLGTCELSAVEVETIAYKALLAWDVVRYAYNARLGFYVGYLTRKQTLFHLERAYDLSKPAFNSWKEFGESFLLGKAAFDLQLSPTEAQGLSRATDLEVAVRFLLNDQESTWKKLAW